MLSKIEQEKEVVHQLKPVMEAGGFAYVGQTQGLIFRRGLPEGLSEMYITIFDSGYHTFSHALISHLAVEEIILAVGVHNMDLSDYRSGLDSLKTVVDHHHPLRYNSDVEPVDSEEQLQQYIDALKSYLVDHGFAFVDHYRNLHHVLAEMDRLEKEGKRWNLKTGILLGSIDAYFRGLIISKLCKDKDFPRKLEMVDGIVYQKTPEWIPYYEKLKQELTTL